MPFPAIDDFQIEESFGVRREAIEEQFFSELNSYPKTNWRFAPSIVCRGENELVGSGSPRFAVRCRICDCPYSFANLRQPELFSRNLYEGDQSKVPLVADALLYRADEFKDFHVLGQSKLSEAYGESQKVEVELTPFVKPFRVGGGVCAQAVAFMASLLMLPYVRQIYSLAEISLMMSESTKFDATGISQLNLGGLKIDKISEFASTYLGLSTDEESFPSAWNDYLFHGSQTTADLDDWFSIAMKIYIRSKCPIIVSMDAGRMRNQGRVDFRFEDDYKPVYEDEDGSTDPIYVSEETKFRDLHQTHAVILVGSASGDRDPRLLMNDPGAGPFQLITPNQIRQCAVYLRNKDTGKTTHPERREFVPVRPPGATVPLAVPKAPTNSDRRNPIMESQITKSIYALCGDVDPAEGLPSYVRLREAGRMRELFHGMKLGKKKEFCKELGDLFPDAESPALAGDHWYWIQPVKEMPVDGEPLSSLWVFDAQSVQLHTNYWERSLRHGDLVDMGLRLVVFGTPGSSSPEVREFRSL